MSYDCISCGPLDQEYHDGRDRSGCMEHCIPAGECSAELIPAVQRSDGECYWAGTNGHMNAWGLPDPAHRERDADDGPPPVLPLPGQISLFDGSVIQ